MPTPMTHAMVGASLSITLPHGLRGFRAAVILGFLAAMPDLDIIGFFLGVPYSNTFGHRGLSHSLPIALLIAAGLVALAIRFNGLPGDHALRTFLVASAAMGSHGLLDMTTDGGLGVGLWMPILPARVFFPFRPIEVSPINPRRFLTDGAPVLASEFMWVWIPIMVLLLAAWIWWNQRSYPCQVKQKLRSCSAPRVFSAIPNMMHPAQLPVSAPSNDVEPEWRHVWRDVPSQHRFETARPFEARTACPRKNAERVPGIRDCSPRTMSRACAPLPSRTHGPKITSNEQRKRPRPIGSNRGGSPMLLPGRPMLISGCSITPWRWLSP